MKLSLKIGEGGGNMPKSSVIEDASGYVNLRKLLDLDLEDEGIERERHQVVDDSMLLLLSTEILADTSLPAIDLRNYAKAAIPPDGKERRKNYGEVVYEFETPGTNLSEKRNLQQKPLAAGLKGKDLDLRIHSIEVDRLCDVMIALGKQSASMGIYDRDFDDMKQKEKDAFYMALNRQAVKKL